MILVNERDEAIGTAGKLDAHRKGLLHRAFSIFIFNSKGELLLQRRALGKYHSGGLWTNTCCSHPRENESLNAAAERRLKEEMGIAAPLEPKFSFIYHAHLTNSLIEHEFDHVFFGRSDAAAHPDPAEVAEVKYVPIEELDLKLVSHPRDYTIWLRECWPTAKQHLHR